MKTNQMEYTIIVQRVLQQPISPQLIEALAAEINRKAKEGWTVITCAAIGDELIYTFERPVFAESDE